jgi:glycosyltransferase involved in cell wall biosynthesis
MTTMENELVRPLDPPVKPIVLPEVVAKLCLGGKAHQAGPNILISFEDDRIVLNPSDFSLATRAAGRVRTLLPTANKSSLTDILNVYNAARKYVSEEVFHPGAVRVLYYAAASAASAVYRCLVPAVMASKTGKTTAHVSLQRVAREALEYDIVVFQIDHTASTRQFAKSLQQLGKKVVFEFDDAFDVLDSWHPQAASYHQPEKQAQVREMLGIADVVIVSTENLKSRYAEHAKRIEVVPNYIDLTAWPQGRPHGMKEFRVLWAGSPSHAGDLDMVSGALGAFMRAHEDVRVIFFGQEPPAGIPADQVRSMPWVDFGAYPEALAGVAADVAIAPLVDTAFNRAKSNIKVLEAWGCRYPIVASTVQPYAETIQHGANGLLAANAEEWGLALESLYGDASLRQHLRKGGDLAVRHWDADAEVNQMRVAEIFSRISA